MQIIKDKVAIVTGGSKGIGLALAEMMLAEGMKVVITSRNQEDLDRITSQLQNPNLLTIKADARVYGDNELVTQKAIETFGKVDVVIANAGIGHFSPIDELSLEAWHDTIDINLTGAFYTLKASLDALKASQGYYITIASLAGINFFEKAAAYNASKFGLVGFTQAVMLDLRKHKIKCSTILPGSVSTHFNGHTPSDKDAWKIQPEDIAQIVIDLLKMHPRTLPSKIEVRPSQTS
jgi:NAD(P)-dependent dehydrogenase (short-subunit alcohol dehydrogenase family)